MFHEIGSFLRYFPGPALFQVAILFYFDGPKHAPYGLSKLVYWFVIL